MHEHLVAMLPGFYSDPTHLAGRRCLLPDDQHLRVRPRLPAVQGLWPGRVGAGGLHPGPARATPTRRCGDFRRDLYIDGGLTAFHNRDCQLCIGVQRRDGHVAGFTRVRLGELTWEDEWDFSEDIQSLFIEGRERQCHLGVRNAAGRRRLRSYKARLLSREFGGRFTGVYLGLYAEGGARLACTECQYSPEEDSA